MRHPLVPEAIRGTYAGLATRPVIEYLQRLGVTAIELLPVHAFVDDKHLLDKGLTDYWGYNTIGFFAPDLRYAAHNELGVNQFKTMVKTFHSAGIEVILDVVYNHTAEGNHLGPTLSFRGIDNAAYYRLKPDEPRYYMDYTGTGNTLEHWNDKYRDTMRAYWKGDGGLIGEFAQRLTGSSDLYGISGRNPYASINFIAHDGYTLRDLVSYDRKHNEANLEHNRDGNNNNLSWNCGVEGPADDPAVKALRARQIRNFLATLLLSQGVPMLLAGDELGRTQRGNNNAYCQDNEVSWVNWNLGPDERAVLEFVERVVRLRHRHPVFRRRHFFQGRPIRGKDVGHHVAQPRRQRNER